MTKSLTVFIRLDNRSHRVGDRNKMLARENDRSNWSSLIPVIGKQPGTKLHTLDQSAVEVILGRNDRSAGC